MNTVKDRVLGATVCFSILLHGTLFFILSKNKEKPIVTKPFRMEWHTLKGTEGSAKAARGSLSIENQRKKNQWRKKKSSRWARTLQEALRTDWSNLAKQHAENQELSQELGDIEIAANGVQVNLEKALRDDRELPLLWKQIRVFLRYRPEHALARISGDVHLRIRLDRFGKLLRIFEESATGREELLGWTILCLLEAFREPFLRHPLESTRTLDLRVQYTMGGQVLPSNANSAKMIFEVEGDRGFSTKRIADTFRDKTLKNHNEWSYYSQKEYYREQCHRHLNQQACKKLQELTQVVEP